MMDKKQGPRGHSEIAEDMPSHSLGELEAQILDIIWDLRPPVTTTQVFKIMYPRRELSYSTIMLTMAKLSRKGVLAQKRLGDKKTDPFVYTPKFGREDMGLRMMDEVSRKVLGKPLSKAIPDLCGAKDKVGKEELARLENLVKSAEAKAKRK